MGVLAALWLVALILLDSSRPLPLGSTSLPQTENDP